MIASILLILSTASMADTASLMQTSRYTTVKETATAAQLNPLEATVQVQFPKSVKTVGDAVTDLLKYSGYRLVPAAQQSEALQQALTQPLPWVDRTLGPLSLHDALIVLVGQSIFTLQQDPLYRRLNFKMTPYALRLSRANEVLTREATSNKTGIKK
jgi:conjugative transfer region protein (TIGR03748 family)